MRSRVRDRRFGVAEVAGAPPRHHWRALVGLAALVAGAAMLSACTASPRLATGSSASIIGAPSLRAEATSVAGTLSGPHSVGSQKSDSGTTNSGSSTLRTPRTTHNYATFGGVDQSLGLDIPGVPTITTVTTATKVVHRNSLVTLVAIVTSPIPLTGTVSFSDNGVPIPGCQDVPLSATPPYVADCTVIFSTAGSQLIVATYSGSVIAMASVSLPLTLVVIAPTIPRGYWLVATDGGVFTFGEAQFWGSMGNRPINKPVVGMAVTPDSRGYWLVASDGGVFAFGDAQFYGSMGNTPLNEPIVGIAATANGGGYWLVASDGGMFAFGNAKFYGSMGGKHLDQPIISMAPTPDGKGYWLVATDGGVFAFGDAQFYGSMGGLHINKPVVGMAPTPNGDGYWLDASDGGVFTFGAGQFWGSMGGTPLRQPMVGMAPTPTSGGYWLDASDGGVFTFGDAAFYGSMGGLWLNKPMVGMATMRTGFPTFKR